MDATAWSWFHCCQMLLCRVLCKLSQSLIYFMCWQTKHTTELEVCILSWCWIKTSNATLFGLAYIATVQLIDEADLLFTKAPWHPSQWVALYINIRIGLPFLRELWFIDCSYAPHQQANLYISFVITIATMPFSICHCSLQNVDINKRQYSATVKVVSVQQVRILWERCWVSACNQHGANNTENDILRAEKMYCACHWAE